MLLLWKRDFINTTEIITETVTENVGYNFERSKWYFRLWQYSFFLFTIQHELDFFFMVHYINNGPICSKYAATIMPVSVVIQFNCGLQLSTSVYCHQFPQCVTKKWVKLPAHLMLAALSLLLVCQLFMRMRRLSSKKRSGKVGKGEGGQCTKEDYIRGITLKFSYCSVYQGELTLLSAHISPDIHI